MLLRDSVASVHLIMRSHESEYNHGSAPSFASYLPVLALASYRAAICLLYALRTSFSSAVPTGRPSTTGSVMQSLTESCVHTGLV